MEDIMNKLLRPWDKDFKSEFFEEINNSRLAGQFLFMLLDALLDLGIKMFLHPLSKDSDAPKHVWVCSDPEYSKNGIYLYCDDRTAASYTKIKIVFRGGNPKSKTIKHLRKTLKKFLIKQHCLGCLDEEMDLRKLGSENFEKYTHKIALLICLSMERYDEAIIKKMKKIKELDKKMTKRK